MGLLDTLMGGGEQPRKLQDFIQRFNRGEGITDQESLQHYASVTSELGHEQYRSAAVEAFSRLSADQRGELLELLRQQASQQNVNLPGMQASQGLQEPGALADLFAGMRQQQPGILRRLLGGGSEGSPFQSPLAKAALAGIAAIGLKKMMSGRTS